MRKCLLLILLIALSASAAPKKKSPTPICPDIVPHPIALFLGELSHNGGRSVTFKATAMGTHFFFEDTAGVTVYRFDNGQYLKQELLRGWTLSRAVKKYAKK